MAYLEYHVIANQLVSQYFKLCSQQPLCTTYSNYFLVLADIKGFSCMYMQLCSYIQITAATYWPCHFLHPRCFFVQHITAFCHNCTQQFSMHMHVCCNSHLMVVINNYQPLAIAMYGNSSHYCNIKHIIMSTPTLLGSSLD